MLTDIAIIGFGFMGAMHAGVYRLLPSARVVAVVDPRGDEVRANPTLTLTVGGAAPHPATLPEPPADGYRRELEYFIGRLEAGLPIEASTGAQAACSLAVTLAEIESAASGKPVSLNQ